MIVTSRDPNWRGAARALPLDVFRPAESVRFLHERTPISDRASARELAEELGHLPLALEQAGAYIEAAGISFGGYLALFRRRRIKLFADHPPPDDYPSTAATTWDVALRRVQRESPAAADLLNLCAFLAPDDIPRDMMVEGAEHLPKRLASAVSDSTSFNGALAALRRYALVEASGGAISVHRLIQAIARDRLRSTARKRWAACAVRIVNRAFPFESGDVRTWSECARLLPHALAAAGHAESLEVAPVETARVLNQAGLYLDGRAEFQAARSALERALRIDEAAHGPEHPEVAIDLNNLGGVLRALGKLVAARARIERALKIDEAAYGPDHPKVATGLNNLGSVLKDLGDLPAARAHLERALKIGERTHGPGHPTVGIRVGNLGSVLHALGDFEAARDAHERAVAIHATVYGQEHPFVATGLCNLGLALQAVGDLSTTRQDFERALAIDEAAFGPAHPEVATDLNNLGAIAFSEGDFTRARALQERVLIIREAVYPAEHPDIAVSCSHLGDALHALRDPQGAREYYERALRIFRKVLGEDHPHTQLVRGKLESLDA